MREVIVEYCGTVMGLVGSMGIIYILEHYFWNEAGLLAQLIAGYIEGGL